MSTNVLVGILIAIVILGGGYLLLADRGEDGTDIDITENGDVNGDANGDGEGGDYQTPVTITTPSTPTVRTSNSATASTSAVSVAGEVRPNGSQTRYWFEYGETSLLGSKTTEQNIGSGYAFISATGFIGGLKADTTYHYRLSARNNLGTTNGSTFTFGTNDEPNPTGSVPTAQTLSANNVEREDANLRGQVNPKGAETRYWFEYGKDVNFGSVTLIQNLASGTSNVSVAASVTDLLPATKYYFRLNAQNRFGTVNGTILNFTTKGPAASSQPAVTTTGATDVERTTASLNGRVDPNGAETTYWFEYSEDSLLGSIIGSGTTAQILPAGTDTKTVSADISGLVPDTKYFYRLLARNQHGTVRGAIMSFTAKK